MHQQRRRGRGKRSRAKCPQERGRRGEALLTQRLCPHAPQRPRRRALLQQRGTLQDRERFLEAGDLCFAPSLPLLIGLDLLVAHLVQLLEVLVERVQLRRDALGVRRELPHRLVEGRGLFCLVLHVLLLCGLRDLVLLRLLLVGRRRGLLCRDHLRQELGKIGFDHLEETDDTTAGTLRRCVSLPLRSVVLSEDLQRQLHALDTLLHLRPVCVVRRLLLCAQLVHLCLRRREVCKLFLKRRYLLLQLRRGGLCLVNLRGELLVLRLLVVLLRISLRELLVAVRLVRCIGLPLGGQPLNHFGDQALHLGEDVVARLGAELDGRGHT